MLILGPGGWADVLSHFIAFGGGAGTGGSGGAA